MSRSILLRDVDEHTGTSYAEPLAGLRVSWGSILAGTLGLVAISTILWARGRHHTDRDERHRFIDHRHAHRALGLRDGHDARGRARRWLDCGLHAGERQPLPWWALEGNVRPAALMLSRGVTPPG